MKIFIIALIFLSACSAQPDMPAVTTVASQLTLLQKDVDNESQSLSGEYKFNMSVLSDPSQSAKLLSIIDLICQNLQLQTFRSDIERAMLADYGVVGSKSLIKLAIKHRCTQGA
jgi:peroxiredoxin